MFANSFEYVNGDCLKPRLAGSHATQRLRRSAASRPGWIIEEDHIFNLMDTR